MQVIKLPWENIDPTNHTERLATSLWLGKDMFVHKSKDISKMVTIHYMTWWMMRATY